MKRQILGFLFLISVNWPLLTHGSSKSELEKLVNDIRFRATHAIAADLIKQYPPDNYVVVGLGRTTGVTGEWARSLSQNENYFWDAPAEELLEVNRWKDRQLFTSSNRATDAIWGKIFPPKELLNGKKLVVPRFLWEGQTMASTMQSMVDYLDRKGYPVPIQMDFVHSSDAIELAVHGLLENNQSLRTKIKVRFTEVDYQIKESLPRDLGYLKRKEPGAFISYGKLSSETVDGLHAGKRFGPNPKYNLLKEAVSTQHCIDLINAL